MKEKFEDRKLYGSISLTLSDKSKWVKDKAKLCAEILDILERYANEGYTLTLRQLYYQLVAAGAIRNDDVVYKKMSGILDDLRYSGGVDWDAIEDRGRVPYLPWYTTGIDAAIQAVINQYRLDRQQGQPTHIEVWTEKDAISGILKRVTSEYQIQLVVNKGYSSSSAMHQAYERFAEVLNEGRNVKILYFGDHDPSGLDMLRDIKERTLFFIAKGDQVNDPESKDEDMDFFYEYEQENDIDINDLLRAGLLSDIDVEKARKAARLDNEEALEEFQDKKEAAMKMHYWASRFEVIPIGLTMKQIKQYNPPPNPAKISDPRAEWYIHNFGNISWEVDALPPNVMIDLVTEKILGNLDMGKYKTMKSTEAEHIKKLEAFKVAQNKN